MKYSGCLVILVAFGCHTFNKDSPLHGTASEIAVQRVDTTRLPLYLHSRESVKKFYSEDQSTFWSIRSVLNPSADSLLLFIKNADRFGLNPAEYHLDAIERLFRDSVSVDRDIALDVLLTDAFLTIYTHVSKGRLDPVTLSRHDLSGIVNAGAIASLKTINGRSVFKTFSEIEPSWAQYRDLKKILYGFLLLGKADSAQLGRALKISLNLERWRWQQQRPERYVSVNIPAFMLRVYEKDSLWLETKVIVGRRETPTPVIESVIRSFIIYPYWHVPKSISTKEILPQLQNDATYLRRNNFDVLDRDGVVILADTIQWDYYTPDFFPFILRQREGSENSMGIIKFNFANNYGVYLHDTNSKRLFERENRDLSHGCVRVKNAVALAHYLVREDDIYVSPEDLDQYLSLQQRLKIDLRKPIELRLEYFTSEVRNGIPFFFDDIYKKDSVMMHALSPDRFAGAGRPVL